MRGNGRVRELAGRTAQATGDAVRPWRSECAYAFGPNVPLVPTTCDGSSMRFLNAATALSSAKVCPANAITP
jgi:hypothetical protein